MKSWGGVDVYIFLTSELVGSKWSDSRRGRFITGKRTPSMHCIGGRMGPQSPTDRSGRIKNSIIYERNILEFRIQVINIEKIII
jgi:hypothetical protein